MKSQQGIGLIEVLVALLLLAVAILGFSAMQINAVKATDEGLMRSRAMAIIRTGSEMMRANPNGIETFKTTLNTGTPPTLPDSDKTVTTSSCQIITQASVSQSDYCSVEKLAARDALVMRQYALDNEIRLKLETCPGTSGTQERRCFIASWGDTQPTLASTDVASSTLASTVYCADKDGMYYPGSQCFILETY